MSSVNISFFKSKVAYALVVSGVANYGATGFNRSVVVALTKLRLSPPNASTATENA